MLTQSEKKVLWHPRGENRFIVGGGSQITLYEWSPDEPAIRHVTSQQDMQHMKCFAWSSDPQYNDLLAVGLNTGHVNLLRIEANRYGHDRALRSNPNTFLPPKSSRACTALAFSPIAPQYLAVGLDKVRGDSSLVVWDVQTTTATLSSTNPSPSSLHHPPNAPPPSPARTPSYILPNTSPPTRPYPVIPRGELGPRVDPRILQAHAPTESVHTLAWLPNSPHLLAAGVSHRWLRLFDLRSVGAAVTHAAGRIHALAPDPSSPHRIATAGDNVVTIWDARKLPTPLLTFTGRDAMGDGAKGQNGPVAEIEFSTVRHGVLTTLLKDTSHVRFWDILTADATTMSPAQGKSGDLPGQIQPQQRTPKLSWSNPTSMLSWGGSAAAGSAVPPTLTSIAQGDQQATVSYNLVLAGTRRTKLFSSPIVSYCLMPSARQNPLASSLMTVTKEGDLEAASIHDTPTHAPWSSRGALAISAATNYRVFSGIPPGDKPTEPWTISPSTIGTPAPQDHKNLSTRHSDGRSLGLGGDEGSLMARGRAKGQPASTNGGTASPATFGRGDDDGFPALLSPPRPQSSKPLHGSPGATPNRESRLKTPVAKQAHGHGTSGPFRSLPPSPHNKSLQIADLAPEGPSLRASPAPRPGPHPYTYTNGHSTANRIGLGISEGSKGKKDREVSVSRARSSGRSKRRPVERIQSVVDEDISMVMRGRAAKGYGLARPSRNVAVLTSQNEDQEENKALIELWRWIDHARPLLSVPTLHTNYYDFSIQGVLGIWDGFPSSSALSLATTVTTSLSSTPAARTNSDLLDPLNSLNALHDFQPISRPRSGRGRDRGLRADRQIDFNAAIVALCQYRDEDLDMTGDNGAWVPATSTKKAIQRKLALMVCKWSLKDGDIASQITRWEKEGKWSQAACWLVFIGKYEKAIELLMRSKDESHHMMSGTLAALVPSTSSKTPPPEPLRSHCERLIIRLQDPYFRAMLTHLTLGDWSEVLEEEALPLRERLAIALQFLDDEALSAYLHRVADRVTAHGDVEGIVVTGLTPQGLDLLQAHVDRTGDVQTAAILGASVHPHKVKDQRAERWLETYKDLLDGWRMFHHRCQLDIERGDMLQELVRNGEAEMDAVALGLVPRQVLLRCNYCSKVISAPQGSTNTSSNRPSACPFCSRSLPRCSICLMHLTIVPDNVRDGQLAHHNASLRDTIEDAIVFCQTCRHGGHAAHILDWFYGEAGERSHGLCPVADCNCRCADEF